MTTLFSTLKAQAPDTAEHGDRWRDRAACRTEDPDLFFPAGTTGPFVVQIEEAKAVCRRCPVTDTCLQWAVDSHQDTGIWGGCDEKQRHNLRRRQSRAAGSRPVPTGSDILRAKALQVYENHSVDLGGGHREWSSTGPRRIDDVTFSPKQVAWAAVHGERSAAPLLTTCSHKGCIAAGHQRLSTGPSQPRAAVECGTRPGYRKHRSNGETACAPCRQANAEADRNLRNTGTTKPLPAERSAA